MDPMDFEDLIRQQNMLMRSVASESETEDKIKMMDIINTLVTDKNRRVHKEAVLLEAEHRGMTEFDAHRVLESLKDDGMVVEAEPGFVRRA